jgi:hypothetical protein
MSDRYIIQPNVFYLSDMMPQFTPRERFVIFQASQGIDVRTLEEGDEARLRDEYITRRRAWLESNPPPPEHD